MINMCEQKQPPPTSDHENRQSTIEGPPRRAPNEDVSSWTLLEGFTPTNLDIIVGTGREPKNHEGNKLFLEMLKLYITRYSNADSKLEKTLIISEIVATVKDRSPTKHGFVKRVQGQWYAVDDHQAREKVSQGLRNILHSQYKSSAKSKKRKRGILCAEMQNNVDQMMKTKRSFLSQRMAALSSELGRKGKNASEEDVEALFTQANVAILEGLKKTETKTVGHHDPNVAVDGGPIQFNPSQSSASHPSIVNQAPIPFVADHDGDINQKIGPGVIFPNNESFDDMDQKLGLHNNWKNWDDEDDDTTKKPPAHY